MNNQELEDRVRAALLRIQDLDTGLIDYLVELNKYSGIWTVSSCKGHDITEIKDVKQVRPGMAFYPYVELMFCWSGLLYPFCEKLSPARNKEVGAPVFDLDVRPGEASVEIHPQLLLAFGKLPDDTLVHCLPRSRLGLARRSLFARTISTLKGMNLPPITKEDAEMKEAFFETYKN